MKIVSTEALTKLIQLVKSTFIKVDDIVEVTEINLATVATSGDYEDLSNKPTVDQIYDGTSTNAQSGIAVASAISGKVTANTEITGATKCKITYDSKGLVTSGADLAASDVTSALGYTPYNNTNPSGYQANVIETIKVNGTAQTVTSKAVDITVPTNNNQLTNGAGYITNAALADYSKTVNTVSAVVAGSTADKINVTKNGSTSTITINNVANATNATKATQDASGNVITTTYATKSELPKTTIRIWS